MDISCFFSKCLFFNIYKPFVITPLIVYIKIYTCFILMSVIVIFIYIQKIFFLRTGLYTQKRKNNNIVYVLLLKDQILRDLVNNKNGILYF